MPQNFLIDFTPLSTPTTGQTPTYFNRLVSGNAIGNPFDGIKMLTSGTVSLTGTPDEFDEVFVSSTTSPVTVLSNNGFTINGSMVYNIPAETSVLFKASGTEWITTVFSSGTSTNSSVEFMIYPQIT